MYTAVIETVPPASDAFVVCLGHPRHLPETAPGGLMVEGEITEESLSRLASLDPRLMARGLTVVTARDEYARHPAAVVRAQKLLAHLFVKFVQFPLRSARVPDPLELRRADTPPEYQYQLNLHRNTPLHLRHGLADKLGAERVGLPCLVLLPGPSLELVRPLLPELARRYLILTISRTLPMLRQCGVVPDILVQLDTVPLQEHFHRPADRFPDSILLALSRAPIQGYAPRFRQVFFIDSFDLAVLANPFRIRESWLNSLLACLGCVELLAAPKVLLAGADLRILGPALYHGDPNPADPGAMPPYEDPPTSQGEAITLADPQGRQAVTSVQYFATAGEAELFAREIRQAVGTTFYNLAPGSLLDPALFAPLAGKEALEAPELDRRPFLDKVDAAAAKREKINLHGLRARATGQLREARQDLDVLSCLRLTSPDAVLQHPCYRYVAANVPWFRPTGQDNLARLAGNLARELVAAARFARNVASLFLAATRGGPLPLLCTLEEEAEAIARLARFAPDWTWRGLGVNAPASGRGAPSGGGVPLAALHDWLQAQPVVVLAPRCAVEFGYALSLVQGDNVLALEELVAYAPVVDRPARAMK